MTDNSPGLTKYPSLFAPKKIGKHTAPNSVKYAACSVSNFNRRDGSITPRELARMESICRTGCGIITNQGAYPDPAGFGKAYYRQISIADDRYLPDFERIANMIHDAGALAVQQILHAGRYGGIDHEYALQSSETPQTLPHFRPPRAMTTDEIRQCIRDHAVAAERAVRVGFDGVEVTAFMGYLLANFLSPFINKRTDAYGGSVENRGRFMVELIDEMKNAIGDAHFWIRLNASELMDDRGGSSVEECLAFMKMAERAGVDGISIVIGWHESTTGALGRDVPTDEWLALAANATKELNIPVAFGPRFGDPILADRALAEGKIDFWEVCRPFLADPDLLVKVREDRAHEIKPCVGGLMCLSRMFRNLPYVCSMNPRLGHEVEPEYQIVPTQNPKTVMVIGGGPAGMEAAVAAARRGHSVSVYESGPRLGGQLNAASLEIGGGEVFQQLIAYYDTHLKKHGIEVHLNTEVTGKLVSKIEPSVCIVATGASIEAPPLPGLNAAQTIRADCFQEAHFVRGKRIVVLGGARAGLVVAERLATEGNEITILDEGKRLATDVIPTFKWRHISWLKELKIAVFKNAHAVAVTHEGLRVRTDPKQEQATKEASEVVLPFDFIVVSGPRAPRNALTTDLMFRCDELYTVGDAVVPRNVCDAVHEGFKIGVRI